MQEQQTAKMAELRCSQAEKSKESAVGHSPCCTINAQLTDINRQKSALYPCQPLIELLGLRTGNDQLCGLNIIKNQNH